MVRANKGAPVSNPGSGSRRTDLAAHSAGQPQRVASGGPHGSRQQMQAMQSAAPMQQAQAPAGLREGVFGPTQRPGEPITAGAPLGPGPGPAGPEPSGDPDMVLRALYRMTGHPDLERILLRRRPMA